MKVNVVKLSIIALAGLQVASAMAQDSAKPPQKSDRLIDRDFCKTAEIETLLLQRRPASTPLSLSDVRREIEVLRAERDGLQKVLNHLEDIYDSIRFRDGECGQKLRVPTASQSERMILLRKKIERIDAHIEILELKLHPEKLDRYIPKEFRPKIQLDERPHSRSKFDN